MVSNHEKMTEKEKQQHRDFYPPFVAEKIIELNANRDINKQVPTKITDFYPLYTAIWKISNKAYQEQYWGKQGQWGDNYGETTLTFEDDAEAILDANAEDRVSMTTKQRSMLQKLLDMVLEYDGDESNPLSRYGENDQAIIEDPKWQEIGKYARKVYEELSGDDLDAWEKTRNEKFNCQS